LYLSIYNTDKSIYIKDSNRYLFKTKELKENITKKIYEIIKKENLFASFLCKDTLYFIEDKSSLLNANEFATTLSETNISLIRYSEKNTTQGELCKYINPRNPPQIDFKIKYNFFVETFEIFDADANYKDKIMIFSLKRLGTSNEVINLIFEPVLKKLFPDINKQNYYIIFENPTTYMIYDIFQNKQESIIENINLNYKFRIQPFYGLLPYNEKNEKRTKVFLTFITRDNKKFCPPMVLMIVPYMTWKELHEIILNKLKKITLFKDRKIEQDIIQMYQCNFVDYEPIKCGLITRSTYGNKINEDKPNTSFLNLIIELPLMFGSINSQELSFN